MPTPTKRPTPAARIGAIIAAQINREHQMAMARLNLEMERHPAHRCWGDVTREQRHVGNVLMLVAMDIGDVTWKHVKAEMKRYGVPDVDLWPRGISSLPLREE